MRGWRNLEGAGDGPRRRPRLRSCPALPPCPGAPLPWSSPAHTLPPKAAVAHQAGTRKVQRVDDEQRAGAGQAAGRQVDGEELPEVGLGVVLGEHALDGVLEGKVEGLRSGQGGGEGGGWRRAGEGARGGALVRRSGGSRFVRIQSFPPNPVTLARRGAASTHQPGPQHPQPTSTHLGGEVADHVGQVAAPEGGHALLCRHAGEAVDDAGVARHLRGAWEWGEWSERQQRGRGCVAALGRGRQCCAGPRSPPAGGKRPLPRPRSPRPQMQAHSQHPPAPPSTPSAPQRPPAPTSPLLILGLESWVCSSSLTRSMGATAVLDTAPATPPAARSATKPITSLFPSLRARAEGLAGSGAALAGAGLGGGALGEASTGADLNRQCRVRMRRRAGERHGLRGAPGGAAAAGDRAGRVVKRMRRGGRARTWRQG